jgi:alpha-tubulin suppressor-like RCC1 family protein
VEATRWLLGPLDGGALKVFGRNLEGQAGDGTRSRAANPVTADSLRGVVLAAGGGRFSLAVTSDGRTHSWGANDRAQLGRAAGSSDPSVGALDSLRIPLAITAGGSHALAITPQRTVVTWGDEMSFAEVPGLKDVVAIAAGGPSGGSSGGHSVAVTARGEVFTWSSGRAPTNWPMPASPARGAESRRSRAPARARRRGDCLLEARTPCWPTRC